MHRSLHPWQPVENTEPANSLLGAVAGPVQVMFGDQLATRDVRPGNPRNGSTLKCRQQDGNLPDTLRSERRMARGRRSGTTTGPTGNEDQVHGAKALPVARGRESNLTDGKGNAMERVIC